MIPTTSCLPTSNINVHFIYRRIFSYITAITKWSPKSGNDLCCITPTESSYPIQVLPSASIVFFIAKDINSESCATFSCHASLLFPAIWSKLSVFSWPSWPWPLFCSLYLPIQVCLMFPHDWIQVVYLWEEYQGSDVVFFLLYLVWQYTKFRLALLLLFFTWVIY